MAPEKLHQKKKIVNLESNFEKINAEKNKISNNLLKLSTELTEVKLLCNGLTNSHENNKNKCFSSKDEESEEEEEEEINFKCKKCDFNSKSRHEVSSHNLMTHWTIINNKFKSKICEKIFVNRVNRNEHMEITRKKM